MHVGYEYLIHSTDLENPAPFGLESELSQRAFSAIDHYEL